MAKAAKTNTSVQKSSRAAVVPVGLSRIRQDAKSRKDAVAEAERSYFPFRIKMQKMYVNTRENGHIKACIGRRKDLTLLRKWEFRNPDKTVNQTVTDYFCEEIGGKTYNKKWFNDFISYTLDAVYYGYTLIWLGDIIDGNISNVEIEKRWNVSPDRKHIVTFESMTSGIDFLNDEEYKKFYVYVDTPNDIGTSQCGYGLFWELSIYEIFARNLLGFNGDFIEVNIAPFRQLKTTKTEGAERDMAEAILRDMGTSGYAVTDMMEEIIFHSQNGGSGYNAYDLFEKRLESAISKLILGHENGIIAKPSALGQGGEESAEMQALEDKQTTDGLLVMQTVNKILFAKMRELGFIIPDTVTACMLNDNEEDEIANNMADLAIKIKNGGLQMDGKYFTSKTGIPLSEIVTPAPMKQDLPKKVQNKLNDFYGY